VKNSQFTIALADSNHDFLGLDRHRCRLACRVGFLASKLSGRAIPALPGNRQTLFVCKGWSQVSYALDSRAELDGEDHVERSHPVRRRIGSLIVSIVLLSAVTLQAQTRASFRVLMGVTDSSSARWDGTIAVKEAGDYSLEAWRFEDQDDIDGNLFHFATHEARLQGGPLSRFRTAPYVANGLVVNANAVTEKSEFIFTTAPGDFRFYAGEIPFGRGTYKLNGRVYIDRIPAATRLTETKEEEDYPSVSSDANGDVWLAWVQFHHSRDYNTLRASPPEVPAQFGQYRELTGGDQIWARKYSQGRWGEPIAITDSGGDLYRTAVAVEGSGRCWVFWSENHAGNFDIFARAIDSSGPKERIQISREAGSDIDPVATTDASGRAWIAWQGWRNGVAAIFAAHQAGSGFSAPVKVSNSDKNEWNPAITADKTGRVAVAWDSYRNGNYDVYERTWVSNSWGSEVPIAASERYEAYPSIAYDPNGRLWIAYEEGGRGWGKDFGAYASTGVALYQGRLVRLRGLESDGRLLTLETSPDSKLTGIPSHRADVAGKQSDSESLDPQPDAALHRQPDTSAERAARVAKNSIPRLMIDGSGRIWLAYRTAHPTWWGAPGTAWTEYLISFDGHEWTGPIFLNHTDNLLDNRPTLAALASGKLLIVNSSDGRRDFAVAEGITVPNGLKESARIDPYNNDLWSQEIELGPASGQIAAVSAAPESQSVAATAAGVSTEVQAVRAIRDYRGGPDGKLRIIKGEFHRHSEISFDGGGDGSLLDQWRYIIDAAAMDWVGCCDHDNGSDREYSWWITQKLTDVFHAPGKFIPMFSYERSVGYPEGHRNVIFAQRGIRPLPRYGLSSLAFAPNENKPGHAADTQMLYAYLREFNGIVASHTSATAMGTDWRDNDPAAEPVVEIYQGIRQSYEVPESPRSNSEKDSIGGWRPKGFVSVALNKGYRLGFEASSDHVSTHMSYANLYVRDISREEVLQALRSRHIYASTDDILADVESGSHMMGDEFSTSELPSLRVKLRGTSRFAKVSIIRDGKYVYTTSPNTQEVDFSWRDNQPEKGKTSYYYVRGEQDNGELVWVSPLWIRYTGN
jgi:hypothetical protein